MRSVAEFTAYAERAWPRRLPDWVAGVGGDETPRLTWSLQPPAERDALADPDAVARWASDWRIFDGRVGAEVEWLTRSWPSLGRQRLPSRIHATPGLVAELIGRREGWEVACEVARMCHRGWPEADLRDGLAKAARGLVRCGSADVGRLAAVLGWLSAHPRSGLFERELPVVGVDTKWFEQHRGVVEPLAVSITGEDTGLRRQGVGYRVRDLGPAAGEGPQQFTVTLDELGRLGCRPARVLICENLTTVASLPPLDDTVALHGMGFAAPSLAEVGWVRDADVIYWGDLDTYGFQILGLVRQAMPQTRSVLMDVATLEAGRAFAVAEPRPFRGEIGHLTLDELGALALLRRGDLRLEQERVPRHVALAALLGAVSSR